MNVATRLPHEPASVAEARAALGPLEPAVDRATIGTLRLLVSELVANSVRHSRPERSPGEIELLVSTSPETVRVEVVDGGRGFVVGPRVVGQDQGSGWGLHLVDTLSDRWGTERDGGMRIWFELDYAPAVAGASASGSRHADAAPG
jgi:anti-sigma regulatory factor (Ser/Thr protein kinase)